MFKHLYASVSSLLSPNNANNGLDDNHPTTITEENINPTYSDIIWKKNSYWSKYEIAAMDVWTIILSFLDPIQEFKNLYLVNKYFHYWISYYFQNINDLYISSDYPIELITPILNVLNNVKKNKLLKLDRLIICGRLFSDFIYKSLLNFPKFEINTIIVYGHSVNIKMNSNYDYYFPVKKTIVDFDKYVKKYLLFLNVNSLQSSEMIFSNKVIYISNNEKCNLINFPNQENIIKYNTKNISIIELDELFNNYNLNQLPTDICQFRSDDIHEMNLLLKNLDNVKINNTIWNNLKKCTLLYPYLQNVFYELTKIYLEQIKIEFKLFSKTETTFRNVLDKWNDKILVKKNKVKYLITNMIRDKEIILDLTKIAEEVDLLVERKCNATQQKAKVNFIWKKFIWDCLKENVYLTTKIRK
ncbi:hypothetical protein ABK040_014958 [Willaertia magna]